MERRRTGNLWCVAIEYPRLRPQGKIALDKVIERKDARSSRQQDEGTLVQRERHPHMFGLFPPLH
jgi:hypothetical protein